MEGMDPAPPLPVFLPVMDLLIVDLVAEAGDGTWGGVVSETWVRIGGDFGWIHSGRGDEGKCAPRTLALERMALSSGSPALNGTPCLDVDQNGGRSPACFCVSRPRNCASLVRFFSAARSIAVRWWGFCGAAATDDAAALERPEPLGPGRVLLPFRAPSGEFRPLASLELAAVISALPTNAASAPR